jgi:hypothetical protein
VTAVVPAAESSELAAFDSTVTAGVSAELCEALSGLAGPRRGQPFEIGFRCARGMRSELPPATVRLPEGAGVVLRAAAARLRQLNVSGEATLTGMVEDLHDDPPGGGDRWRIKGASTRSSAAPPAAPGTPMTRGGHHDADGTLAHLPDTGRSRAFSREL